MARYILKPVFWNTFAYERPSGARATSGYAQENGYGHEEWNNSERMSFAEDGERWHAFHTEGIGNVVEKGGGSITVFLYASRDGEQALVSAATHAQWLGTDRGKKRRIEIADLLNVDDFIDETWALSAVRNAPNNMNSKRAFLRQWRKDRDWIPNWVAPAEHFYAAPEPVPLHPMKITGKNQLLQMYSRVTEVTAEQAVVVLDMVPTKMRNHKWANIRAAIGAQGARHAPEQSGDIEAIYRDASLTTTERKQLVAARIGQGAFRDELMRRWDGACAVTRCMIREALRASHLKSWEISDNRERLDPANGLLLIANLDALFDRGLISFRRDGRMLVSQQISAADYKVLGLGGALRKPLNTAEQEYLARHRETWGG